MNELLLLEDDDEAVLLLSSLQRQRVYNRLEKQCTVFRFDSFTDDYCFVNFRFYKDHIRKLHRLLRFPDSLEMDNGTTVDSLQALCVVLRRFSYPNR